MPETEAESLQATGVTGSAPGRPMRILHLIPGLGHGGGEHQLLLNVTLLDRSRFESVICHMEPRTVLAPEFEKIGVPVHSAVTSGFGAWFRQIRRIRTLVKELNVDVIHATNSQAWLSGGIVGRLTGKPVVSTLNSNAYEESRLIDNPNLNRMKLRYGKMKAQFALRLFTHRYVAISNYVKSSYVSRLGLKPDRVDVVHRGVPKEYFESPRSDLNALKRELGIEDAYPVLLNVARLVAPKGQRYAIEALPKIIEAYPNARLLLVGMGNREKSLRKLAKQLGVDQHINFVGTRDDVRELHAVSDMFLFPSVYEGFGSALGEAMAAGNLCITTGEPPMTEIVEHEKSGLHVPSQDPGAITDAVLRVAGDGELRERLTTAGRDRARNLFTIESGVAQLEQVYSNLAKELQLA